MGSTMADEAKPFDIDAINEAWAKDCVINDLDLVAAIRDVPVLHARWINKLSHAKVRWRYLQVKYNKLRQTKFRYYRGEMGKDELEQYGWPQYQGIKPLKTEMNEFLQGDKDLNDYQAKIDYMDIVISTLEQIVRSINSRGYDLRAMLEAKKFYNGNN